MRFFKKKKNNYIQTRNDGGNYTFNEIKTPVGASSERLMSESLSRSFKRFVQTADSSDV